MKVTIDIPEWADGRHISIMAGIELVAYRDPGGPWFVKSGRCNSCGLCCTDFKKDRKNSNPPSIDGTCIFLKTVGSEHRCSLGTRRPFSCCVGIGHNIRHEECTEKFTQCE